MIDPKLVAEVGASLAVFKSDAGKRLLSPLAEKLGLSLGDLGEIYRFYQNEILEKIFTKWAASRSNKPPLSQEEFRKVMPLLQLASVQSDEELHTRWAALLENTVMAADGVLPSFGQTLSQLTSAEARFLDRLFAFVSQPKDYLSEHRPAREPLEFVDLVRVYDPSIDTGINPAERELFKEGMSEEQLRNYDRLTQAELVIQDLVRLGIITHTQRAEPSRYIPSGADRIPIMQSRTILRSDYAFTQYGVSFIRHTSHVP